MYGLFIGKRLHFDRFLSALLLSEKDTSNTSGFLAKSALWDLFDLLDRKRLNDQHMLSALVELEARLNGLPVPTHPIAQAGFAKITSDCHAIINAARHGALRTTIRTKLPLLPVITPTTINTQWKLISTTVVLTPFPTDPRNTPLSTEGEAAVIPFTPSQWQQGHCDVQIDLAALVDRARSAPSLTSLRTLPSPYKGWPGIFFDAFEILDAVIWKLRQEQQDLPGKWIPTPSDVATIEWELWAGETQINTVTMGPPGVVRFSDVPSERQIITLDISEPIEWHKRCRILAEHYLASGETNEALFWLNVGIEALFETLSKAICTSKGINFDDLSSREAYWDAAEEVLASQFPDMAKKVRWPEPMRGIPSWFTRIRYLSKLVPLKRSAKDIGEQYARIQQHRSVLFHGIREGRETVESVNEALSAFEWLEENFVVLPA